MGAIFWYYMCMGYLIKNKDGSIDWGFVQGLALLTFPMVVSMF